MATAVRISTLFAFFLLIAIASGASLIKRQVDDLNDDGLIEDDLAQDTEDTVEDAFDDEEDVDGQDFVDDDGINGEETMNDDDIVDKTWKDDGFDEEDTMNDGDDDNNEDETWNDEDFDEENAINDGDDEEDTIDDGDDEEDTINDGDDEEDTSDYDDNDQQTLDNEEDEEESWEQADIDGEEIWNDLDAREVDSLEKALNLLSEDEDTDDTEDFLKSPYDTQVGNNVIQRNESPFDEYRFKNIYGSNQRNQGKKADTDFWSDFKTRD